MFKKVEVDYDLCNEIQVKEKFNELKKIVKDVDEDFEIIE